MSNKLQDRTPITVKTDGIQGFQSGNRKKTRETSARQQRSISRWKLQTEFESR